jgi:cytochrome b pre-mRNA-processing protein 3
MFARLFKRSAASDVPQQLYGSVVAQSRQPEFFTDYGFKDTVTGRYDVVALHLFLFSRRMVREDTPVAQSLNQEVFDTFTDEMDRALRELGVGDTSVPKRKKRMVHSFYAIVEEFAAPLDAKDMSALAKVMEARFAEPVEDGDHTNGHVFKSKELSSYVIATADVLDKVSSDTILKGELAWAFPNDYI